MTSIRVEIRWLVDMADQKGTKGFESYIKDIEGDVTPVAVESTFRMWLEDKVRGKNIIVSDLEIFVDGKFYILEREQENKLFQRIGAAAGK